MANHLTCTLGREECHSYYCTYFRDSACARVQFYTYEKGRFAMLAKASNNAFKNYLTHRNSIIHNI